MESPGVMLPPSTQAVEEHSSSMKVAVPCWSLNDPSKTAIAILRLIASATLLELLCIIWSAVDLVASGPPKSHCFKRDEQCLGDLTFQ